jgi:type II secretory pathway predicted ATPase ExeA
MHHEYWGLRESPFAGNLDLRFFHQSVNSEEALARLHFLPEQRRRLGLLLGPSGVGKSQLLQLFRKQLLREGRQVATIQALGVDVPEFLVLLATRLGLCPAASTPSAVLWRQLDDHLVSNRYQKIDTVVLLDDADEAEPAVLAQVARLVQCDSNADARLTVVLSAREDRISRLGARLLELAELRIDLEPWQAADTTGYVRTALAIAGRRTDIFQPDALARIHELSEGVPRRVKQLAELALLAAAGQELRAIDAETVEGAYFELGVITGSPPTSDVAENELSLSPAGRGT